MACTVCLMAALQAAAGVAWGGQGGKSGLFSLPRRGWTGTGGPRVTAAATNLDGGVGCRGYTPGPLRPRRPGRRQLRRAAIFWIRGGREAVSAGGTRTTACGVVGTGHNLTARPRCRGYTRARARQRTSKEA